MTPVGMEDRRAAPHRPTRFGGGRGGWLWPAWFTALGCWTVALLATFPVKVNQELLPETVGFSVGKALHVTAYAILAVVGLFLPCRAGLRWLPFAVLSLHAVGTEFAQQFVDRSGCWQDVLLDHAGILLGIVGGLFLERYRTGAKRAI